MNKNNQLPPENELDTTNDSKKDKLKKEADKKPVLRYYDVKVECMIPATLTYRVLAEDPYKAAEAIKGKTPNGVQHKIIGRKEKVLKVYDAGSSIMRLMRNLLGV